MSKIRIVGAGFSGLTLAYFLRKKGIEVEIFEKENQPGGLLHTHRLPEGLVETAANGLLSCELLSTMCEDLGVRLL
ncbi:MAG: NAD(P)/FAD-dependent oxidoreductase, partial [Bdellovibrionales bacterium]|nr:NAD(P)/FAD-dependent oxidoreductase [Bdellovibrionales bacterium]